MTFTLKQHLYQFWQYKLQVQEELNQPPTKIEIQSIGNLCGWNDSWMIWSWLEG